MRPTVTGATVRETRRQDALPRLEVGWEGTPVVAGLTTRELNFGRLTEAPAHEVHRAHRALRAWSADRFHGIVRASQVHGVRLFRADGIVVPEGLAAAPGSIDPTAAPWTLRLVEYDGFLTATPGVLLTIGVADCVPSLLFDPDAGAVALVHAGWRGVADEIVPRALEEMRRVYATDPARCLGYWGPSIGRCCYPVGPEVVGAIKATSAGPDPDEWVDEGPDGPRVDLRAALTRQARSAGIVPSRIGASSACTACDAATFHSYRRAGGGGGRMVFYAGIPDR